jgi:phosphohistidine phosphatase SixA
MLLSLLGCARFSAVDSAADADSAGWVDTALCADTGSLRGETADTAGDTSPADTDTEIPAEDGLNRTEGPVTTPTLDMVIYAVRHAEKDTDSSDPGLTEEGQARAEALAALMTGVPIAAIYATDLRRTQDTVRPTAEDHGLPIVTDIDPEEDLATWIRCMHAGDTVLHAGHSYTLPDFFEALGLPEVPDVDGYGQLFTLRFHENGSIEVEESRFGE